MKPEVQCAITFILEQLCSKLPRHKQDLFADELDKSLVNKFNGHWYPESPCKGSGYRCLRIGTREMDAAVAMAIQRSGLEAGELSEALQHELSIWVDPGEVSYRMGEKGTVTVIYREKRAKSAGSIQCELDLAGPNQFNFNPEAEDFLPMTMDSLTSSMRGISLSPVSALGFQPMVQLGLPTPAPHQPLPHPQALHPLPPTVPSPAPVSSKPRLPAAPLSRPSSLTFTAASFAQTKFGSTKLKSAGKKVNFQQLSPTEFANYMKQRSAMKGFRSQRSPVGGREFPLVQGKDDGGFGYWSETPPPPQSYPAGLGFDSSQSNHTQANHESWMIYDSLNAALPSTDQYGHQSLIAAN
ncbi:protein Tob1-like [Asterias amurensis]|uniref:protein Tob1-like n=1 Tax=Asterias amurensis TaxID=7602 RepID=UPI003AB66E8A